MAIAKGYRSIAGFKKATTWGTPVLIGANDGIEFRSEGLKPDAQFIADDLVSGNQARLFGDKGNELHSGDMETDLRFQGIERIVAQAMGTAGVPVQQATSLAYKHTFKVNNDPEGIFGTLVVFHPGLYVREYSTAKVGGFSVNCANGERAHVTLPMIPQGVNYNTTTGTNTTTTAAAITLPSERQFALFSQMVIQLNAQGGADFVAGDTVYPSEFEVTFNRQYTTDDVTTRFGTKVDEPVPDDFLEVSGRIRFSKLDAITRLTDQLSKARQKMKVVWTGPLIEGSYNFQWTVWFPDLQFSGTDANVGGPARVPEEIEFMASRALAIPTGFPAGYTDSITIDLINKSAVDALA